MELRLAAEKSEYIREAAERSGETASEFVRNAAMARAEKVMALSNLTFMPAEEFDALIETIDTADETPNLDQLMKRPKRFVR